MLEETANESRRYKNCLLDMATLRHQCAHLIVGSSRYKRIAQKFLSDVQRLNMELQSILCATFSNSHVALQREGAVVMSVSIF